MVVVLVCVCVYGALSVLDYTVALNEHDLRGISKVKFTCLFVDSFSSASRVGASLNFVAR